MTRGYPTLPTRVGHAEWGDNRFRGYSLADDLAGNETFSSLLALGIAGRRFDENERMMLDELAIVVNAADPRIWQFKLVRLVSAYGGCNAGVAALTVSLENAPIGHHAAGHAAEMLLRLRDQALVVGGNGSEVDERLLEAQCRSLLADSEHPSGFWVPFRPRDERVDLLARRVAALGRGDLLHWRLFEKTADVIWRIANVRPNIPAACAAVCLDMRFTPEQIGPLMTALGAVAFWANAFEGAEQAPACLQTLPDGCVRYVGPSPRLSPRAAAARSK